MPRVNLNRRKNQNNIQDIEDAELSVLTGPITDVIVTVGEDHPPKGYYRISQSAGGDKFFLHDRKTPVYINVKKEPNWDRAAQRPCVTALAVVFPQRQEFVPPGFSVVRIHSPLPKSNDRNPANLNLGDEQVFLCFRRSREGNPITAILPLLPAKREYIPEGFTVLERTPRNHVAAIQTHSSQVFLAYRQRLANLEPLRPLPLVMSVHASGTSRKLNAYYCTGGTVVDSRVGRFHIMDRSTHNLLSPSSISNRLSLIEASRRKTLNSISDLPNDIGANYVYSVASPRRPNSPKEALTSSLLLVHGLGTPCSRSVVSDLEKLSINGDSECDLSADMSGTIHLSEHEVQKMVSPSLSTISGISEEDGLPANRTLSTEDSELQRCLEALSFIPVVSTAIEEDDPRGMLRFQARVAVLTPILTACYTRHGGSALLAVEGLVEMLRGDFFSSDVNLEQDSSSRITLLDISIQVVCDVATMGAQEIHLQACVEFVQSAVEFGCGHLNTKTVGYVMRFYLFVFYFGASAYSGGNGIWGTVGGRDQFILDDPRSGSVKYLPGGAPQAAILSLKDLISFSMARLQSLVASEQMLFRFGSPPNKQKLAPDFFNDMINRLVDEVVDQSVHRVEIANYTQLAMHQIQRSGGSELFWYDMMNSCGSGLFGNDEALREETKIMYSMIFAILTNCVKVASTKIRRDKNNDGVPRDVASKLMSLEMIHFFLVKWDGIRQDMEVPNSPSYSTFIFTIRRLVVPCLFSNTSEAIDDPKVYRRVMNIIGVLWGSPLYRKHMKLELATLMDHFVIKILRLGPQILFKEKPKDDSDTSCLFAQQIELMKSLQVWFSDSPGVLELFLNFDTDQQEDMLAGSSPHELISGLHWKTTQKTCAALCIMCEKCSEFIAEKIRQSQAVSSSALDEDIEVLEGVSGTTLARESAQRLRKLALDTIGILIRNLAESAAACKGKKYRDLVESWGKRSENVLTDILQSYSDSSLDSQADRDHLGKRQGRDAGILGFWQKEIVKKEEKAAEVMAKVVENETNKIDHLGIAFDISREKGLRKGIDYLIAVSVLTPSPRDIASFLRLHRAELEPAALGKYLGEAGSDVSETEYWNLIRFSFVRAINFVGMTVEQGLRHLLTSGGFRLPGEAQQVDRLISTFAQCYWEDNAGDQVNCPFNDQDTVFLLSFAIIMLNTDLHKSKPTSNGKKSTIKRMTKVEFVNNLKGVVNKTDELSPDYLSIIYDSIEAHPIVLKDDLATSGGEPGHNSDRLNLELSAIVKNAKSLEALLRGLSTRVYRFTSIHEHSRQALFHGNLSEATTFLVRKIMSQTWHQFHGLINASVENAHLDLQGMESCSTVLKYALALTICLDMPMERSAFLGQLGRFRNFTKWRRSESCDLQTPSKEQTYDFKHEDWYTGIEEACTPDGKKSVATMDKNKVAALKLVDELIVDLSLDHSGDNAQGRKATRDAVRCLANAEYLLNDPTRQFLRTGKLWKRANRSGRLVEYRFFLFSDVLIYAKKIPTTSTTSFMQYKIHGELQLILMKVTDWFHPEQKKEADRGFQIYHPRKSFLVFAADREERTAWVSSTRSAIDKEISRQVAIEGARKAAAKSH